MERLNTYFVSDFHLGVPSKEASDIRERQIVKWLDSIKDNAKTLYLLGDIFDFWFEYKKVVPKGYIRLLGKLAELSDDGIEIKYFIGNHDMWVFDYFEKELGITIYENPIEEIINGKAFYIGHGDGLGKGDYGYKMIKAIFRSKICQFLFGIIHPNIGISLGNYWSGKSRLANGYKDELLRDENKEFLISFSKQYLKNRNIDYFIFGHRHLPLDINLNGKSRYINTGEWIYNKSYAIFDGENLQLKKYIE
ncbi:MAG: UDP-2,3-diacylglucosamine hydrolase [Bacteroidetes bacterium GWE2_29_8]|nr:MAG: UDP-2,3-diacylglucosamine hydrolase [Bacteroidetes bacterium GWE2_29_8]OFY20032.1 MAG: UDP-2,3-diacylglucosamine hydrolase [Bacteroidetes bacterium GWF2_29_10]